MYCMPFLRAARAGEPRRPGGGTGPCCVCIPARRKPPHTRSVPRPPPRSGPVTARPFVADALRPRRPAGRRWHQDPGKQAALRKALSRCARQMDMRSRQSPRNQNPASPRARRAAKAGYSRPAIRGRMRRPGNKKYGNGRDYNADRLRARAMPIPMDQHEFPRRRPCAVHRARCAQRRRENPDPLQGSIRQDFRFGPVLLWRFAAAAVSGRDQTRRIAGAARSTDGTTNNFCFPARARIPVLRWENRGLPSGKKHAPLHCHVHTLRS